jgi:hypothetical protein
MNNGPFSTACLFVKRFCQKNKHIFDISYNHSGAKYIHRVFKNKRKPLGKHLESIQLETRADRSTYL